MNEYVYAAFDSEGNILRIESGIVRYLMCPHSDARDDTHYVDLSGTEPVIKPKQDINVEYTQDGLTVVFGSLPAGVRVEAGGSSAISEGGPFEIEFDIPGTYLIQFHPPAQYLDTELEVTIG